MGKYIIAFVVVFLMVIGYAYTHSADELIDKEKTLDDCCYCKYKERTVVHYGDGNRLVIPTNKKKET